MSKIRTYERVLGAFLAAPRADRIGRVAIPREGTGGSRGARLWINGHEVGDRNARFAHLARSHD